MFCPNCGTKNPDTAQTCSKCNFHLKGAAAPKFKGTMLMMNQPGGAQAPVPPRPTPGAGPSSGGTPGAPPGIPSRLKGTMVGVAPPASALGPPAAAAPPPSATPPPAAAVPGVGPGVGGVGGVGAPTPAPAPLGGMFPGGTQAFGPPPGVGIGIGTPPPGAAMPVPTPSPFAASPADPVNPLGGTIADNVNSAGAFGTPPPGAVPPPAQDPFAVLQPQQGNYGPPPQPMPGYGAPMQQQTPPPPQASPWGAPQPNYAQTMPSAQGGDVNTTIPLIVSIIAILCCALSTVGGVVGLLMSLQAKKAKEQGDLATARQKAKLGLLIPIVAWVVNAILIAVLNATGVFAHARP